MNFYLPPKRGGRRNAFRPHFSRLQYWNEPIFTEVYDNKANRMNILHFTSADKRSLTFCQIFVEIFIFQVNNIYVVIIISVAIEDIIIDNKHSNSGVL